MLLGEWASKGVAIAYLEQTSGQNPKYYSCLLQSANGEREAALPGALRRSTRQHRALSDTPVGTPPHHCPRSAVLRVKTK